MRKTNRLEKSQVHLKKREKKTHQTCKSSQSELP
jgi:hypothetical protein